MKGGKRCLIVRLGQYKIEELTSMKLEPFAIELLKNGRVDGNGGLSNKSVIDICTLIKNTLKFAKSHGEPVSCDFDSLIIKKKSSEMRVLSKEETNKLINVVSSHRNAQISPTLRPVNKHTNIPILQESRLEYKYWHNFSCSARLKTLISFV